MIMLIMMIAAAYDDYWRSWMMIAADNIEPESSNDVNTCHKVVSPFVGNDIASTKRDKMICTEEETNLAY